MRISDWISDVVLFRSSSRRRSHRANGRPSPLWMFDDRRGRAGARHSQFQMRSAVHDQCLAGHQIGAFSAEKQDRSEEHTSELQSLMRISYAVFCLKKKKNHI